MTISMQAAADIADRMASSAPEHVEQPKNHVAPLRYAYAYGSKKRKAKRLASQAKGLYHVEAARIAGEPLGAVHWYVLASGPKRAQELVNDQIRKDNATYLDRVVYRICGVTAGTKERIL